MGFVTSSAEQGRRAISEFCVRLDVGGDLTEGDSSLNVARVSSAARATGGQQLGGIYGQAGGCCRRACAAAETRATSSGTLPGFVGRGRSEAKQLFGPALLHQLPGQGMRTARADERRSAAWDSAAWQSSSHKAPRFGRGLNLKLCCMIRRCAWRDPGWSVFSFSKKPRRQRFRLVRTVKARRGHTIIIVGRSPRGAGDHHDV